jgi:imidazolonepropionase-like amidohydrolase
MTRSRVLALILVTLLAAACRDGAPEGIALVGATVIDGSGGPPLRDAVIVIRGTQVDAIGTRASFRMPKRLREVDVTGKWIVPGLIDAHAHAAPWALPRYLAWGVTSIRDVHGQIDTILALRDRVNLNAINGPRIYSAGAMLDGEPPTYPDAFAVGDANAARKAVDSLVLRRADALKLYTRIDPPLLRAALEEARTFNLRATAHLGLTDAVTAASLGLRSIEHLSGVPEAASSNPAQLYAAHRRGFFAGWTAFERSWVELDSAALARVAGALAERQVVLVPTLVLHETFSRLDEPATYADSALAAVPEAERARWNTPDMVSRAGWVADDFNMFRRARAVQDLFIRVFRAAGGIVATGTDAANQQLVPGESEHREMELLVRAGVPPEEALLAATRNAALLVGADSIGTIAPGRVADLVILSADPHLDIRATRAIEQVMVRGLLMNADSLRRAW